MRINHISKSRDFEIYRNFSWSSDLNEFGQFNLIYGWNRTRKTTLSRLLRNLEHKRSHPESHTAATSSAGAVPRNAEERGGSLAHVPQSASRSSMLVGVPQTLQPDSSALGAATARQRGSADAGRRLRTWLRGGHTEVAGLGESRGEEAEGRWI